MHLQIKRFVWLFEERERTIEFTPGFNLLNEGTQGDRTRILRLIRYAMGGSHSRIDSHTMENSGFVQLQLIVDGSELTTSRGFEHPDGQLQLRFEDGTERMLSPQEMGEFLLDWLGIPKVHYLRGDQRVLVSFNDIARTFVVDRDISYPEILAKLYPEPRKNAVKIMLGLTSQEIADVEESLRKTEIEIARISAEIKGIERMLEEFNVKSSAEIEGERRKLMEQLRLIGMKGELLRGQIRKLAQLDGESVDFRASGYEKLREEMLAARTRQNEIRSELAALGAQETEKTELRDLLQGEVEKIDRYMSSKYILSSFTFSQCPRCLQWIDSDMHNRENWGDCMLCGRTIKNDNISKTEDWTKSLADAKKAVTECKQLLSYYQSRIDRLSKEDKKITNNIRSLESELSKQTATYISPLLEELNILGAEQTQVSSELVKISQDEKQRNYANRIRDTQLPNLRQKLQKFEEDRAFLQAKLGIPGQKFEAFLAHYRSFMRQAASGEFKEATWDEFEMLPRINNQEHTKALTGYNLAIAVLAFHYSLLAMKVILPKIVTPHPGLLIIDEPEQQKMGQTQFETIMNSLVQLAASNENDVQVVVAATNGKPYADYFRHISIM
jgi:hypothetical protein